MPLCKSKPEEFLEETRSALLFFIFGISFSVRFIPYSMSLNTLDNLYRFWPVKKHQPKTTTERELVRLSFSY